MTTAADPKTLVETLVDNIGQVIIGKRGVVELSLVSLLSKGHLLIEDVPGVGKTMLARSIAVTTGCEYRRMQFTPDLLPSDVTGASVYNQKEEEFQFRAGPVIAQIVLADEINRATPKTQSALLEAMGERQVSVDGVTYELPEPFMVMATQNPIEYEGTFPLPEAQLDRFFMRVSLGYPDSAEEVAIMDRREQVDPIDELTAACGPSDIMKLQSGRRQCLRRRTGEAVHRRPFQRHPRPRRRDPWRVASRVDQPDEGLQGDGHAAGPRLRGPRRHQADRRAGHGPPRPAGPHRRACAASARNRWSEKSSIPCPCRAPRAAVHDARP